MAEGAKSKERVPNGVDREERFLARLTVPASGCVTEHPDRACERGESTEANQLQQPIQNHDDRPIN